MRGSVAAGVGTRGRLFVTFAITMALAIGSRKMLPLQGS